MRSPGASRIRGAVEDEVGQRLLAVHRVQEERHLRIGAVEAVRRLEGLAQGRDARHVAAVDEDRLAEIDDLADQAVQASVVAAAREDVLLVQELGVDAQVGAAADRRDQRLLRAGRDRPIGGKLEDHGPAGFGHAL